MQRTAGKSEPRSLFDLPGKSGLALKNTLSSSILIVLGASARCSLQTGM